MPSCSRRPNEDKIVDSIEKAITKADTVGRKYLEDKTQAQAS
ncbi:MAG TPA: hypothetical protein VGL27_17015 [Negativicutes bacterium]